MGIRRISDVELPSILRSVLAQPGTGQLADVSHVQSFTQYLRQCALSCQCHVSERGGVVHGAAVVLLPPGGTAIIMFPPPGEIGIGYDEQRAVLQQVLELLADRDLYYAQVLTEAECGAKREMLDRLGFWKLARLLYLERGISYPWTDPPAPDRANWVSYTDDSREHFFATVQATYRGSLDCPGLSGLRPIEAVMAGHRSSGQFDPRLWQLAVIDGKNAGCLLLSHVGHDGMIEVVYMGVTQEFRGRGVGPLLLQRAISLGRGAGVKKLTLVVDDGNAPAITLYGRFGFEQVAAREAYLYQWRKSE